LAQGSGKEKDSTTKIEGEVMPRKEGEPPLVRGTLKKKISGGEIYEKTIN